MPILHSLSQVHTKRQCMGLIHDDIQSMAYATAHVKNQALDSSRTRLLINGLDPRERDTHLKGKSKAAGVI